MKLSREALVFLCVVGLAVLSSAARQVGDPPRGHLQPFAGARAGQYVDRAELRASAAPAAGSTRLNAWRAAQEDGLEALILQPRALRGDYLDLCARHASWVADAASR